MPYATGGKTQSGADCTGAIYGIYQQAGIDFPYHQTDAFATSEYFEKVPAGEELQVGDIGVWTTTNGNHAVMYDPSAGADGIWGATHTYGAPFGPRDMSGLIKYFGGPPTWYRLYGTE